MINYTKPDIHTTASILRFWNRQQQRIKANAAIYPAMNNQPNHGQPSPHIIGWRWIWPRSGILCNSPPYLPPLEHTHWDLAESNGAIVIHWTSSTVAAKPQMWGEGDGRREGGRREGVKEMNEATDEWRSFKFIYEYVWKLQLRNLKKSRNERKGNEWNTFVVEVGIRYVPTIRSRRVEKNAIKDS